ncbi:hypothetical protein QFZ96_002154 [Paraburkholderia youngii]
MIALSKEEAGEGRAVHGELSLPGMKAGVARAF